MDFDASLSGVWWSFWFEAYSELNPLPPSSHSSSLCVSIDPVNLLNPLIQPLIVSKIVRRHRLGEKTWEGLVWRSLQGWGNILFLASLRMETILSFWNEIGTYLGLDIAIKEVLPSKEYNVYVWKRLTSLFTKLTSSSIGKSTLKENGESCENVDIQTLFSFLGYLTHLQRTAEPLCVVFRVSFRSRFEDDLRFWTLPFIVLLSDHLRVRIWWKSSFIYPSSR